MTKPQAAPPTPEPQAPIAALPTGAVDAHVHLVGSDFDLWDGRVEDPAPGTLDDWLDAYRAQCKRLGFEKGVNRDPQRASSTPFPEGGDYGNRFGLPAGRACTPTNRGGPLSKAM